MAFMGILNDNYKYLLKKKGVTSSIVSLETGVSQSSLSKLESGKSLNPRPSTLAKIAEYFGVTTDTMLTSNLQLDGYNFEDDLRKVAMIPLISWVQAGDWQEAVDNLQPGEGERIPTVYSPRDHTYALRVSGDSMEPKFSNGDVVIVEPNEQPENGNYVIVRQNGDEATFKQLQMDGPHCFLKPLNPRYPIMEMQADAVICGVVKWKQAAV